MKMSHVIKFDRSVAKKYAWSISILFLNLIIIY